MKASDKVFIRGLAVGAAYIARNHGEPQYAKWIVEDNGYDLEKLVEAGVDQYDITAIYPIMKRKRRKKQS